MERENPGQFEGLLRGAVHRDVQLQHGLEHFCVR
jgi:hypothetical protein